MYSLCQSCERNVHIQTIKFAHGSWVGVRALILNPMRRFVKRRKWLMALTQLRPLAWSAPRPTLRRYYYDRLKRKNVPGEPPKVRTAHPALVCCAGQKCVRCQPEGKPTKLKRTDLETDRQADRSKRKYYKRTPCHAYSKGIGLLPSHISTI